MTRVSPSLSPSPPSPVWVRRAQLWMGTLVEVGVPADMRAHAWIDAAFERIGLAQRHLSRFDQQSDVGRFAALPVGECTQIAEDTRNVLHAAWDLHRASDGAFDITQGTAPSGWALDDGGLRRLDALARLDLGGIAKGYAVDCAVGILQARGCAAGWVNAGGDLRAFGDVDMPVLLRDEQGGGVRPFAQIADAAMATSHFSQASRSSVWAHGGSAVQAHVSVLAECCMWADALTKIVAVTGDAQHRLLEHYGAHAWLH